MVTAEELRDRIDKFAQKAEELLIQGDLDNARAHQEQVKILQKRLDEVTVQRLERPSLAFPEGPEEGILEFAAAIKDAREKDGFLVLDTHLLGNPDLGDRILVREAYPMLWARLQQMQAKRKFVITGQPGVGKTFWLIWLLIRLVKEDRPVLWHDSYGYHLFIEDTVFRIKPEHVCLVLGSLLVVKDNVLTKGEADSKSALPMYLIDGQQPLLCAKHWALLAHSPNFSRYSEFLKSRRAGSLHFMPPFELEELMQLRPVVLPGEQELTEAVVLQRFQIIGGVPRDIFMDYSDRELRLRNALNNMDVSQVAKATYAADTFSAASHQLILITVPEWRTGDFKTIKVKPRSFYVAKLIWEGAQDDARQELCMRLVAGVAQPGGDAGMHETLMHLFFPKGGAIKSRLLDFDNDRQRPRQGRPAGTKAAKAGAGNFVTLPCYEVVEFNDVGQLQLDPEVLEYFKPESPSYPAVDSFTSDGNLFNATLATKHNMVPTIVRTLQAMPEQCTPKLYWVVGTKKAFSGFPAAAKPFADKLNAATLDVNCPPDEPSAEFWTAKELKWEQVPRKARHLLAELEQYVMWLEYDRYAHAKPVAAETPELDDPFSQGQLPGALPSARGSAWGRFKQHPVPVSQFTSRPKSWCRCARKPVMRSTLHGSMCFLHRNTLLPKTML